MTELAASDPDSPADPSSRMMWRFVLARAWHGFLRHRGIDSAAALSFFAALGILPGALSIVSMFAIVSSRKRAERDIMAIIDEISVGGTNALGTAVESLLGIPNPAIALLIGFVLTIWTFSAYATACGRAINTVYDVQEGRQFVKFRGLMMLLSLMLTVVGIPVIVIVALTPKAAAAIGEQLSIGEPWLTLWNVGKWPVLVALIAVVVTLLYYYTPNVRHQQLRAMSAGAAFATVAWALCTAGFAFYVANIALYDEIYGWVGGAVIILLWLFISNLVLVIGAELDAEIVRLAQLRDGVTAEEVIQLPMRDTTRNLMLARQRAGDITAGRAIRESAIVTNDPEPRAPHPDEVD